VCRLDPPVVALLVAADRWRRAAGREVATARMMARTCGAALGMIGAIWSRYLLYGLVIGGAMTCSMLTAGFMGTIVPMLSPSSSWLASLLRDYLR
jgi:Mg/Co/Ni transporter MgtE